MSDDYYRLNVCVLLKFICWNLILKVTALGGENCGSWLHHKDRALIDGISAFVKETAERSPFSFVLRGYSKKWQAVNWEEGSHQMLNLPRPWSWTSLDPELWEINFTFLWSPPICRFYCVCVCVCVCVCMCVLVFSHVWLFATLWAVTHQASLSWIPMEFSRQECWSGLPFPSPGDLSNPGIEPGFPTL